jgi:hypothetical protein
VIDRELYLPRSWIGDLARCQAAGIPVEVEFATKPQLARRMIERAIAAGVPFAWFAADQVYGDNGPLRTWLEEGQVRYVLAVSRDHRLPAGAGHTIRADALAAPTWSWLAWGPSVPRRCGGWRSGEPTSPVSNGTASGITLGPHTARRGCSGSPARSIRASPPLR